MTIPSADSADNTRARERDLLALMPLARELAPRIHVIDRQTGAEIETRSSVVHCLARIKEVPGAAERAEASVRFDGRDLSVRGVFRCGSVWCCPLCAARAAAADREAVSAACRDFIARGYAISMCLGTVPHKRGEALAMVKGRLDAVKSKVLAIIRRRYVGAIKVEYVWNNETSHHWINSWHPHNHFLFFIPPTASLSEFNEFFIDTWCSVAKKLGVVIDARALQAEAAADAEAAARYIAKDRVDGAAAEIAGGPGKTARGDHLTPLELLERIHEFRRQMRGGRRLDRTEYRQMRRLEELYREYVEVYHGAGRRLQPSSGVSLRTPEAEVGGEEARTSRDGAEIARVDEAGWTREVVTGLADLRDELRQAEPEDWFRAAFGYFVMHGASPGSIRPGADVDPADWLTEDDIAAILAARDRQRVQDEMDEAAAAFAAWQMAA